MFFEEKMGVVMVERKEKKKMRDACGNNKTKKRSTTLSTCLRVYGHPLLTTPKGNDDCLPIAYGSFSQYRRNDPPGQPMAEVLCACRLSTDIVEYTSTHHTRKARKYK